MTDNLAVFIGHQRDDTVAGCSQFFYEFSFGQLTEGRRNDLVYSFPVSWVFIANVNHPHPFSTRSDTAGKYGSAEERALKLKLMHYRKHNPSGPGE
jgi:hypothetical protein